MKNLKSNAHLSFQTQVQSAEQRRKMIEREEEETKLSHEEEKVKRQRQGCRDRELALLSLPSEPSAEEAGVVALRLARYVSESTW